MYSFLKKIICNSSTSFKYSPLETLGGPRHCTLLNSPWASFLVVPLVHLSIYLPMLNLSQCTNRQSSAVMQPVSSSLVNTPSSACSLPAGSHAKMIPSVPMCRSSTVLPLPVSSRETLLRHALVEHLAHFAVHAILAVHQRTHWAVSNQKIHSC